MLTDMLNKAYSDFVLIRDAKDAADLFLEFSKGREDTLGISLTI